jgi:hypothetical protein
LVEREKGVHLVNNRAAKVVIGVVSSVIAVIAVFSILRAGFAFWLYSYIGQWVTVRLGLDYYAAELLTVVLTTAVMFFVPGFGSLIISRRQRLVSAGLVVGGYLVMCGLVYTVGRNVYFNRVTGDPLRYYVDTPQGREFSFTPGFHPRYGIPFKPYTQAVVQEELRQMQLQEEKRRKAEVEEQRRAAEEQKQHEIAEQKRLAEEQRRQEEERLRAEADAQRQQELERQRLADETRRKEELEIQQREADAQRQHEQEMRRLEAQRQANEQARASERQKLEAEERAREREARQQQEEDKRRRDEESRRRKEETTRQIIGIGREAIEKIRRRPN